MRSNNIFLVGPMGVGKTTIGRQLARSVRLDFIDSDHEIERRTGANISWIFDIEGEQGFRERERQVIEELSRRHGIVLATGGGAILDKRNRDNLSANGTVIYLRASVSRLVQRTAKDSNRPLLQTEDRMARMRSLMEEREPLYCGVADIIIDTDKRNVSNSVKFILSEISKLSG